MRGKDDGFPAMVSIVCVQMTPPVYNTHMHTPQDTVGPIYGEGTP